MSSLFWFVLCLGCCLLGFLRGGLLLWFGLCFTCLMVNLDVIDFIVYVTAVLCSLCCLWLVLIAWVFDSFDLICFTAW